VRLNHQLTTLLLRNCPPSTHPDTMYLLRMRVRVSLRICTLSCASVQFCLLQHLHKSVPIMQPPLSCMHTFIQELALTNMAAPRNSCISNCGPEHHVLSS